MNSLPSVLERIQRQDGTYIAGVMKAQHRKGRETGKQIDLTVS